MTAFFALTLTTFAQAEKRVALVIGNGNYKAVAKLNNPANDAQAVAALLKSSGFDVVEVRHDLSNAALRRAVNNFSDHIRGADIAVVYFAGHGIEVDGTNYLIPVDAELKRDIDVEDEALPLDRVVKILEPVRRLRLVILDACRDNPFAPTMKRTLGTRSIGRGLARVEPSPNTLIAFAAKAGSTADDGDGERNSPFTAALVRHIAEPGLDLRIALGRVRDDVLTYTKFQQEPFVYGSLGGNIIPLVAAREDPEAAARRDFESAVRANSRDAWERFISRHQKSLYANLGRASLAMLIEAEKQKAAEAAERARAEAAEKARREAAEKARIEAEKAEAKRRADEEKAAQARRAAEAERQRIEAQKAAEKARLEAIVKAKAEAAEKARREAAEKARIEAEKAEAKRRAEEKAAEARRAAEAEKRKLEEAAKAETKEIKVAALPGTSNAADITRSLQVELRRVGCHVSSIDGRWNASSQKAMENFNRYAGMQLGVSAATEDALDAVRGKKSRICPLICQRGFRADGERCVAITCPRGQVLGSDGTCAARPKAAARSGPNNAATNREGGSPSSRTDGSIGVVCDTLGCRSGKIGRANRDGSLPAGCQRVNTSGNSSGIASVHSQQIICN